VCVCVCVCVHACVRVRVRVQACARACVRESDHLYFGEHSCLRLHTSGS